MPVYRVREHNKTSQTMKKGKKNKKERAEKRKQSKTDDKCSETEECDKMHEFLINFWPFLSFVGVWILRHPNLLRPDPRISPILRAEWISWKYSCTRFIRYHWVLHFLFFFRTFYFPASGQVVVTGVVPSPPRFLPSFFIANRVQQSHCLSIFHRVFLTHALAFSASQFVRKKKPPRINTSMHSGGFGLTKLAYTRLENNLIRHRGDRLHTAVLQQLLLFSH